MNKLRTIFLLYSLIIVTQTFAQWVPSGGPDSARITALTVHDGTLFAGTYDQGIFRSTDSGSSWTAANNGLVGLSVGAIAAMGTLLFSSTDSGFFRSEDNGDSWVSIGSGIGFITLAFANDTIWGAHYAAFRSTDNGDSWEDMSEGLQLLRVNPFTVYKRINALSNINGTLWAGQSDIDFGGGLS